MRLAVLSILVAGCGSSSHSGPCAVEGVTGSLPGVTLAIRSSSCTYAPGEAAHFTYEVTTDANVPAIATPGSGGGCGSCQPPSTDPLSWVTWTIGGKASDGTDQVYCLCDVGCCPPETAQTIRPAIATESATIDWSGHTWTGPSDTGNPQGPPFRPGGYDVTVTFDGFSAGTVTARLPIAITPY